VLVWRASKKLADGSALALHARTECPDLTGRVLNGIEATSAQIGGSARGYQPGFA